jgi:hypothetical protein
VIDRPQSPVFTTKFPIRLVVDHGGPAILEQTFAPEPESNSVNCRIVVSDKESGVAWCAVEVSLDDGLTWSTSSLGFDSSTASWLSADPPREAYMGKVGPFVSGRRVLLRVVAADGVGNMTIGQPKKYSLTRVLFGEETGRRAVEESSHLMPARIPEYDMNRGSSAGVTHLPVVEENGPSTLHALKLDESQQQELDGRVRELGRTETVAGQAVQKNKAVVD